MNTSTPTLARLLREAQQQLAAHSDSPRLDAELLLAAALGRPRSFLYAWPDHAPTDSVRARFAAGIAARGDGAPVAYLLGNQPFHGLELQVTPDVLVPRADTEVLVEAALARLPAGLAADVADLGTGSGAVALAIANARPLARVTGIDISPRALAVAAGNGRALGLELRWLQGDWSAPLADASLDMLVSNPPYIAEDDPHLAALAHEPRLALVAGADGLDALRIIIADGRRVLRPGGWLLVEHGWQQGEAVRALFAEHGYGEVTSELDLAGHERVTLGLSP